MTLYRLRGGASSKWTGDKSLGLVLPHDLQKVGVIDGEAQTLYYDAVRMLREHNAVDMNDNMDAVLQLELTVDMRTDKLVLTFYLNIIYTHGSICEAVICKCVVVFLFFVVENEGGLSSNCQSTSLFRRTKATCSSSVL